MAQTGLFEKVRKSYLKKDDRVLELAETAYRKTDKENIGWTSKAESGRLRLNKKVREVVDE